MCQYMGLLVGVVVDYDYIIVKMYMVVVNSDNVFDVVFFMIFVVVWEFEDNYFVLIGFVLIKYFLIGEWDWDVVDEFGDEDVVVDL